MNLNDLRLLADVAQRGSFAAAARALDVDPSSVSRTIAALERELGVRLFQRSTRRMTLTEAGALYLARAAGALEELDQARDRALAVSSGPAGTLRMTASVAFGQTCLVPLIPKFRRRYPQVALELRLTDANLDLVGEQIDLAVRLAPRPELDAVAAKLFDTRYRVCASPAYLETSEPISAPPDLSRHSCVLIDLPRYRSRWRFERDGVVEEVAVGGAVTLSSALAVHSCAVAGLGPALLADWMVDADIAAGRLVELFQGYRATATEFETAAWLIFPSRAYLPEKVRAMIDYLRQELTGAPR